MSQEVHVAKRLRQIDQNPRLFPEWKKAIHTLTNEFHTNVAPLMPNPQRRGSLRNVLLVGAGGRMAFEAAAAALALGPAKVVATDVDTQYERFAQDVFGGLQDDLGHDFFSKSQVVFGGSGTMEPKDGNGQVKGTDIFFHKPNKLQDVVIAMGVHPRDVVLAHRDEVHNGVTIRKGGVDKIIEMAREDGGVVVFSKHSAGPDLIELLEALERRKQEYGDISISKPLELTPGGLYIPDMRLVVVKRHKPEKS